MPMNKPHLEFHPVDMGDGWHTPAGYPVGIKQKILASDIDETQGTREPHRQHGNERLAAGDDHRVGIGRKARAGLFNRCRPYIVEGRCLHPSIASIGFAAQMRGPGA